MSAKSKSLTIGKAVADLWLTVSSQLFDGYQPERHYMRGPGPKWHAKHDQPKLAPEPDLGGMTQIAA